MRLLVVVLFMSHLTLSAQIPDTSDISSQPLQPKWITTLVVPSVLAGYGLLTMNNNGPFYNSYNAYEDIQNKYPDFSTRVDDYLVSVPAITVYGLNLAGIQGKNSFLDRSLIYLTAYTTSRASYRALKRKTRVLRPDSSDYRSFPSGHTTLPFVSATFLFEEYKEMLFSISKNLHSLIVL